MIARSVFMRELPRAFSACLDKVTRENPALLIERAVRYVEARPYLNLNRQSIQEETDNRTVATQVKRKNRCSTCGKSHTGDCWYNKPRPTNDLGKMRCFNCNMQGHFARDCRRRGAQNRGQKADMQCFACQRWGHLKRDCVTTQVRGAQK